jgi:type IV secretory pathway VirB2 component (pilin)
MLRRWTTLKHSERLRAIGWCVLTAGLAGAVLRYWITSHSADRALDDTTALGYAKSLQHGVGVMMGPSGAILTDLQQNLTSPLGQALAIALCTALAAGYFFRVAWVLDADDEERQDR